MGIIEIEGMEFYAFHGHFEEERIVGNRFLVDLKMEVETQKASISDNLDDAVNYQTAYNIVKAEMHEKSYLLEHIAQRILNRLFLELQGIQKASIKVRKINPPMGGVIQSVGVTLSQSLALA